MIFSTTLMAAETAAQNTIAQPSMWEQMLPMVFIFAAVYFIMIRPQTKKAKEQSDMLSQLKPGDEVITAGGIIGRIKNINDDFFSSTQGVPFLK